MRVWEKFWDELNISTSIPQVNVGRGTCILIENNQIKSLLFDIFGDGHFILGDAEDWLHISASSLIWEHILIACYHRLIAVALF